MTRGEMRETVRVLLGETVEDGVKDTEINTQLDNACVNVAIATKCLTTFANMETIAFDDAGLDPLDDNDIPRIEGRYGLPDDLLAIQDVIILDGSVKTYPQKKDIHELERLYATVTGGLPRFYGVGFGSTSQTAPTRGDIWFRPWPDAAYDVTIHYIQRPSKMDEDNDYSELPEFSHMAVCYYATMVLSRKWKDRELLSEMAALYRNEMNEIQTMVHQQDMTGSGQIRNVYQRRR
ncbi:MAG: hypothetical protein OEV86_12960 [Candidatus Krumholzibacteria bacterium]|nr:hypothetical protein [Candidatus Krumholzibacteria bacterium]